MDNKEINKMLKLIAEGDNEALVAVYEAMRTQCYGLALSILKDREMAEDVMQTTFLKVKQNAHSFTRSTSGKAWILKITHNEAIDCIRRRHECLYHDPGMLDQDLYTDGDIERATDSIVIQEAMKILTPRENQIVFLHLYCELKHREVGKVLGIPSGTAGRLYNEAIRKLKLSIAPELFQKKEEEVFA